MSVSIATLALDVDARPVDAATRSLASLDAQAVRTGASTERLASLTQAYGGESAKAASAAEQMGTSIRAQEAALRSTAAQAQAAATAHVQLAASVDAATNAVKAAARPLAATATEIEFYRNRMLASVIAQTGFTEAQARASLGMAAAETEAIALGAAHADVAKKIGLTSTQIRELLVLTREGARGDITRFAGSFSILAGTLTAANIGLFAILGGLVAVGAAVATVIYGISKGEKEIEKLNGSLIATGNYAGETANNMDVLAKSISASSDTTIGSSRKTVEALVATGTFGKASVESVADAVQNYSRITGESSDKIMKEYEGQKGNLIKWAVKHEEAYHDISVTQLDHIALLIKEGEEARAQDELNADIDAKSKERLAEKQKLDEAHFGWLEYWAHRLAVGWSKTWDQILGIGRGKTLDEKITAATQDVMSAGKAATNVGAGSGGRGNTGAGTQAALAAKYDQAVFALQNLNDQKAAEDAKAAADAAATAAEHSKVQAKYGVNHTPRVKEPHQATNDYEAQNDRIDGAIASAKGRELTAQLALTTDIEARFLIEQKISQAAYDAQKAAIDRQIALIAEDQTKKENARKYSDDEAKALTKKLEGIKVIDAQAQADKDALAAQNEFNAINAQQLAALTDEYNIKIAGLEQAKALTKSTFAAAVIEKKILDLKYQEQKLALEKIVAEQGINKDVHDRAVADLKILEITHTTEDLLNERNTTLLASIKEATDGTHAFFAAIKSHDWQGVFDNFTKTLQTVQASFASHGLSGGLSTLAGAAGAAVGGQVGNALSTFAGITGIAASAGAALTTYAAGAAGTAFAAAAAGANAVGVSALGSLAGSIAPLLGPIGIAIAGIAVLASLFVKSKPTNAGATYDLATGAISGSKADASTSSASKGAGSTILSMENALIAAGVKLTTTVNSIEIGARDLSKINLSTGAQLTAKVGDAADTANVAMKAILEGATFATEAEHSLVTSMLAAGKGFDDISAALQGYTAAQGLLTSVTDAILQITDPKQFDLNTTKAAQDARDAQLKAALDAGYLTASQFSAITVQLTKLKGLEIDKVMAKYAAATTSAADAVNAAANAVATAQGNLKTSYQAESAALQSTINSSKALATTLTSYKASLGAGAGGALTYDQAKAAFDAAKQGDGSGLPTAGAAFLAASLAHATDATQYARDIAEVSNAVQAAADTATATADIAQMQLDEMTKTVDALITINASVLSVVDAIKALDAALAAQGALTPTDPTSIPVVAAVGDAVVSATTPANDNGATTPDALNPQTIAAALAGVGGGGGSFGSGVQMFAQGGIFTNGIVSQPTAFNPAMMGEAGPEAVMPLVRGRGGLGVRMVGGSDNVALLDEIRQMRAEQRAAAVALAISNAQTAKILKNWDGNGQPASRGY
ncbi:phage tail length tape measure family protein [Phenylobacterium sp.]|uniref:phage tail length tape measure family protein n=1 Tax=Phenylobacterium sp. TaxID=1871053 RepID=UPI00374DC521